MAHRNTRQDKTIYNLQFTQQLV